MFRQYRNLEPGEHLVVGGDCSQGGADSNCTQFLSKTKHDVPLVYHGKGVAAQMTTDVFPVLQRIHKLTGIIPTVAFERQNGGASEMERLDTLNRNGHYEVFLMPKIGQDLGPEDEADTKKYGWDTSAATRPIMLGDLKHAINTGAIRVYDPETLDELDTFIVNANGKPEAAPGRHDDTVMALAIAWQLFNRVDLKQPLQPQIAGQQAPYDKYGLFVGV